MSLNNKTTAFPGGVTNVSQGAARGFPAFYPPKIYQAVDDFQRFNPDEWAVANAGSGTLLLGEGEAAGNGALRVTTGAASGNATTAQWKGDPGKSVCVPEVLISPTKSAYFSSRFSVSLLSSCQFLIGLLPANTAPFAGGVPAPLVSVTNGAYFAKSGNNLVFVITKGGVSTTVTVGALTDNIYAKAEFNYNVDGNKKVEVWFNDKLTNVLDGQNFPDNLTLARTFGITVTAASARILKLDYLNLFAEAPGR